MNDRFGRFLQNWRVQEVLPFVKGELLDIGCGMNLLVDSYSGKGTGVDVYPWTENIKVLQSSSSLPFENGAFDTVSIIASLNHIPERVKTLNEVNRVLCDGGQLVITMLPPVISRIWHFMRSPWDADQKERTIVEGEVYGFTEPEVRRLLSDAGFEVILKKTFMLRINRLYLARKISGKI